MYKLNLLSINADKLTKNPRFIDIIKQNKQFFIQVLLGLLYKTPNCNSDFEISIFIYKM